MTKLEKNALYDKLCRTLTDYETNELFREYAADEFYELLVEIQNNWEELTVDN